MTLTPESMQDKYATFTAQLAQAHMTMAEACVSADFRADFNPNHSIVGVHDVDFAGFKTEIERQRVAFPDLGLNVDMIDLEVGDTHLRLTYDMTVRFAGPLKGRNGTSFTPTGKVITIRQTDTATFGPDGLITRFVVESNVDEIVEQLSS